jgi:hypothetical protein
MLPLLTFGTLRQITNAVNLRHTEWSASMKKPKELHAVTVRLEAPTWEQIEQLAQQDRRPVSQMLRLVIEDFAAGKLMAA